MKFAPQKSVGCGLGLRPKHYPDILGKWPRVDWFEAISENFMDSGGRPIHVLEQIRSHYPVALHGVALSIGSSDPLNQEYLARLKQLIARIDPFLVSDHLCWSGVENRPLHDLLPLPFTKESLNHVVSRVSQVQDYLGRAILLENVSSYVTYKHSEMPEWTFISEVAKRSGCGILLDVNNIYVNAINHQFDASEYICNIPSELIGQIHLAGHTDMGEFLFDTHGAPIINPVWNLYRETLMQHGLISTLIEWDEQIPTFERLLAELDAARKIYDICEKDLFTNHSSKSGKPFSPHQNSVSSQKYHSSITLLEVESKFKERMFSSEISVSNLSFLNSQGTATGFERAQVYANGYPARMIEALKETYETIYRILGEELFADFAHSYINRYPSRHYNLNYAGQFVPEFLEQLPEHIATRFPFLRDLALLEWKCWEAFHAYDDIPFQATNLLSVPIDQWENAKLMFQPSVSIIETEWPVFELWKNKAAQSIEFDLSSMKGKRGRILIGRRGDLVRCEPLSEYQFELLRNLIGGDSLGLACERLSEKFPEMETFAVAEWFSAWVQSGLVTQCVFA